MKVIHLKTGWNDPLFDARINDKIKEMKLERWLYYDIKISSKDNNCLLIFKKERDQGC